MKRSNKKNEYLNPLFERWIEEWKEEAASRDLPLKHAMGKALNSLKKFPLTLPTGKSCAILEYFGPKICLMLDKKLDKYKRDHNLPLDATQIDCYNDEIKEKRKKKNEQPSNNLPSTSQLNEFNSEHIFSNNDEEKRPTTTAQEKLGEGAKKKNHTRKTINRPYVPKIGSGAYALLITLYNNTKGDPNKPDFMLKKDLISEARHYCDSPMKQTALEVYSGWSSMSTLIEKNLVTKKSSPAKYSLTDAGFALALQLKEAPSTQDENDENLCNESQSESVSKNCKHSRSFSSHSSSETISVSKNFTSLSPKTRNNSENCNEIKSSDVSSKSDSTFLKKSDDILILQTITADTIVNSNSNCSSKLPIKNSSTPSEKDDVIIILDNDDEDDNVFEEPLIKCDDINIPNDLETVENDQEFQVFCKENIEPLTPIKKKPNILFTILDGPSSSMDVEIDTFSEQCDKIDLPAYKVTPNKKTKCLSPLPKTSETEIDDAVSIENKTKSSIIENVDTVPRKKLKFTTATSNAANCKKTTSVDTPEEKFYLLPNNFDIILLVDTQETSGGKTRPKDDATISELSTLKTVFEIRSLKVGDFAWIARCRFTNRELTLPFIVERKRIDDLASSIKDGRYHEQKFRLRQSGIKNVIYLIENYGTTYYGCMPITSLFQAAVNSLVQDNFQVKFTKDHKDSMSYLATITKMLTEIYESKELVNCKKQNIELENADCLNQTSLMEFSEFNKSAMKTKNFKVREMLIRQLLQLKGLSVDKAVAITEVYPSPKVLCNALKQSDEKLLASIVAGSSNLKIGPAISKTIWQFYTQHNFA